MQFNGIVTDVTNAVKLFASGVADAGTVLLDALNVTKALQTKILDALQQNNFGRVSAAVDSIRGLLSCADPDGSAFCWAKDPRHAATVAKLKAIADERLLRKKLPPSDSR